MLDIEMKAIQDLTNCLSKNVDNPHYQETIKAFHEEIKKDKSKLKSIAPILIDSRIGPLIKTEKLNFGQLILKNRNSIFYNTLVILGIITLAFVFFGLAIALSHAMQQNQNNKIIPRENTNNLPSS